MSKRQLPARDREGLTRFAAECRRGERTHWTIVAAAPVFVLWNSWLSAALITFANAVGNSPFLATLRYNRARVLSSLSRRPIRDVGAERLADTSVNGELDCTVLPER
jgi:hypothetical protein